MIAGLLAATIQVAGLPLDQRFDHIVAHLGRGNAPWADIDAIARYRCAAIPQLVRELRIMPPGHYFPTHQNLEANIISGPSGRSGRLPVGTFTVQ